MHHERACGGQFLCTVSHSQISLLPRNALLIKSLTNGRVRVTEAWNVGQYYQVKLRAWRACQGQLLSKVWHSQISLLYRNALFIKSLTNGRVRVTEAWNVGQYYQVTLRAWRACQGLLLCKVWHSQISLLLWNAPLMKSLTNGRVKVTEARNVGQY